jgi:hypothetical protein
MNMKETQKKRLLKLEKQKPQEINIFELEMDESQLTEEEKARFDEIVNYLGDHRDNNKIDMLILSEAERHEFDSINCKLVLRKKDGEVVDLETVKFQPFD